MASDDEVPELVDVDEVPELVDAGEAAAQPRERARTPIAVRKMERDKVPITLLTGYLGAGKSTLLDYILTENHGYRIAVCMNDYGDTTDIEAKALQFSNDDGTDPTAQMLALPNGCLCCSVKDLGIAAIEDMVAAQREKIDWVVVELTGLADPAPIAKSFWANEEMGELELDSVVCVVDSRNVLNQIDETREDGSPNECQRQIACADVILLNKTDLVTPEVLDEVASAVAAINPTLRVYRTDHSQIGLEKLFNIQAYAVPPPTSAADGCAECAHSDVNHAHTHGHHAHGITTTTIPLPHLTAQQFAELHDFLEEFIWAGKLLVDGADVVWDGERPEILRTKGYLVIDGVEKVVQGVADLFEIRPALGSGNAEPKLVFIGRRVDTRLGEVVRARLGL
ncbi:cobW-domain-containing protein [Cutaneotrichosporon oleaginosum]|uniref:CobW-domain-containing protein n=1 Tax=Cutaneotrichosporon oleaginosum TaxID=879819 RepID=A0A0J0XYF8_9TREE|nr:cobW-domain-containing protein [Cutaneotrichosporon oleaginosum]KLT46092.1 cobW-domain-containing protein [Cutaneotrichosporon oleaginosum]TXT10105.1 hypothetical protein COLE_04039 [Cutaneotrichosporon oleaginosum]